MNETIITARMHKDGTVLEVLPDGSERPFPKQQMRQMTEEEIYAAALSDPDAQPLTEADLACMKRVSRAKTIRRALQLTLIGVFRPLPYSSWHVAGLGTRTLPTRSNRTSIPQGDRG